MQEENRFIEGIFRRHERGFGFVIVEGEEDDIYIAREDSKDQHVPYGALRVFAGSSFRCGRSRRHAAGSLHDGLWKWNFRRGPPQSR